VPDPARCLVPLSHPSEQTKDGTAYPHECSALALGAQQRQDVLEALLEDLIGELSIRQGAGELQRPDIMAKMLSVFTRADCGSSGARPAAMSSMTASTLSVWARLVASVQRPISSSTAAEGQPLSGLSRAESKGFCSLETSSKGDEWHREGTGPPGYQTHKESHYRRSDVVRWLAEQGVMLAVCQSECGRTYAINAFTTVEG
jgi:hypothetical protein